MSRKVASLGVLSTLCIPRECDLPPGTKEMAPLNYKNTPGRLKASRQDPAHRARVIYNG